ncbi:glycosyltransferase family 4 protein [Actinomadura bangladeshensis]|uniref:Glycosyltransferase family 4 protein n=1 Tax=Actinomadura bangladeshensis TaxID=453573 RepID=A0A6L9QJ90_9ACTN|nr:glycosyltransferase family 4 protein [Actinomadura bangladeshensis]NEA25560.1 glycosyltransferase family 4 protein [Actinomadura bangladeshensis]
MRVLMWHVHGSWATSFVHGEQTTLVPVTPDRGPDGKGRPDTFTWPDRAVEVPPERLRGEDVDVVVLQRPHELRLAEEWLGRRPGRDVPAVYVEHDTPRRTPSDVGLPEEVVPDSRHLLHDRSDIPVVHVTHFNQLFWNCGRAPTRVIEHGVVDPGYRCTADMPRAGVVINDPLRRGRVAGTDLLPELAAAVPLDLFGMNVTGAPERLGIPPESLWTFEDLPQARMHEELARRRVYVHPYRWTSLGLALIEAMMLGLPVVALATTEAVEAVPPEAGVLSTRVATLADAARTLAADPPRARQMGKEARAYAVERYGLARFLRDWRRTLQEVAR